MRLLVVRLEGVANRIVLWPLGGIAFVNPPRRPGAYLWSIAAGPLVNVILLPVLAPRNPDGASFNALEATPRIFVIDLNYIKSSF